MGNPISANPCSLAAVKSVMQSFKGDLNIPHSRQWSIVGWHGLPYLLSHRVIHDIPELQDLLIQPWLGHFEINMSKGDILDLEIVCVCGRGRAGGVNGGGSTIPKKYSRSLHLPTFHSFHVSCCIIHLFLYHITKWRSFDIFSIYIKLSSNWYRRYLDRIWPNFLDIDPQRHCSPV